MGLLESLIKKVDDLEADLDAGKIDIRMFNAKMRVADVKERVARDMIAIKSLDVKANNSKASKWLAEAGVVGGRTCIDMRKEEREAETIRCPINDNIITRAECLEYSGGHMDECEKCHHFGQTRKLLVDDVVFVRK